MLCVCKFSNINCHDMIKRLRLQLVYNCYCVCNSSSRDFQGLSVFVLNSESEMGFCFCSDDSVKPKALKLCPRTFLTNVASREQLS